MIPSMSSSKSVSPNLWILVIFAVMLRWIVSFYNYSGQGKPPMYGDYEAQRHWMEITVNLPAREWYVNSTRNDLQYWGLDYPPLTAYHSLVCGYIAYFINPAYVKYNDSRGYETPAHKLFMRSSVVISDLLSYLPAACLFSKISGSQFLAVVLLIYPGIILIDHGHFQYNCVSLGLSLLAFSAFIKDRDIIGSIIFCLALNFKQMVLYYSMPVFFYLLGKCIMLGWKNGMVKLLSLAAAVIITFGSLWWPFFGVTDHVVKRIFPLERGLFEDKVSNFWCFINLFLKVRNYEKSKVAFISACITLIAVLPSSLNVFFYPTPRKLLLSLVNSSLAFFLFSYQVHEKTILFVSLPVVLVYLYEPLHSASFLFISSLSMLPLLIKDHLFIPFITLNIIYLIILICFSSNDKLSNVSFKSSSPVILMSSGFSILHIIANVLVPPPVRYPHLYPLLISLHCATHFIYYFLYFNWFQFIKCKSG